MGRAPCCDKANVKKGPWSPEEDAKLKQYLHSHGTASNWISLPQKAGLRRCGKSCRLRWLNYLRPNIKHGDFSDEEDRIICTLFTTIGSRWSVIAAHLPGRTDNDIKNYWNTKLKKKLIMGMVSIPPMKPNSGAVEPPGNQPAAADYSFVSPNNGFLGFHDAVSFAGEGSCSSSDGSSGCINGGGQMGQLQNYFSGGFEDREAIISGEGMVGEYGWSERQNCMWGETASDYGLEEIKRLISAGNWSENEISKVLYF